MTCCIPEADHTLVSADVVWRLVIAAGCSNYLQCFVSVITMHLAAAVIVTMCVGIMVVISPLCNVCVMFV